MNTLPGPYPVTTKRGNNAPAIKESLTQVDCVDTIDIRLCSYRSQGERYI